MSLFTPKRLLVKPQSRHSKITQEIIARARTFNPDIAIEYLNTADFVYPVDTPREKFLYMKESAIISERSEDFIRTFDSPGNIVESLTTVLNLSWMCANSCEFCYLQTNQTPEHYFYTNLERAEHEIAASPAAHAAILTLWTHLSDYFAYRLNKLPDRFKETADWIRELYFDARVRRDDEAVDRYYLAQENIAKQLSIDNHSYTVDPAVFRRDRATIKQWYSENLKYPFTLSASEFNDFLAVDHLTDNSAFLMRMIERYPRFKITIRSRSNFVDGFLRYDGQDRVRFNITLNTEYAINEFEHGTASLEERLHTARRIQEAKGYLSSLDTSFTLLRVLVVSTHRLHLEEVIGGSFDLDRFTEFILDGFDLQPRCPLRGFVVHGQCLLGGVDGRPDIFTTEILVNKEGFVEDADVALLVDPSDEVDLSRSDGQFDRRIKRESLREAAERKTTGLLFSKLVFFVALVVVMLVTEASRFFLQVLEVSYFL